MRVVLANPLYKRNIGKIYEKYYIRSGSRWPHSGVKRKGQIPHYLPFPFSLSYSAGLLNRSGFEVYAIDAIALDLSENCFLSKLETIKPDFVFFEITAPTVDYDLCLAEKIKNRTESLIAIGGSYINIFAEDILQGNQSIDFAIKGEYELILLELLKTLRGERSNFPKGVIFRKGEDIIDKGYYKPVDSLDNLGFPMRDIFPVNDCPDPTLYWDGFCQKRPSIQMQSSRGCFYNCYFCLWKNTFYYNSGFRSFSIPRIIEEMKNLLSSYKIREIYFDDDDFAADKNRLYSLCNTMLKNEISVGWSCMANISGLTEDSIALMAKSGCIGVKFGVESGSERVLKTIGKVVNLKEVKKIVDICRKYGIKTHAAFIIGLWRETEQDVRKTEDFSMSLDVDSIQVSIAAAYPGTRFYELFKKDKLISDDFSLKCDGKLAEAFNSSYLNRVRKKILANWVLKKFLSLWCIRHFRIIMRTFLGLGISFWLKQLFDVSIDEYKNG